MTGPARSRVLPGFRWTMAFTLVYLGAIVLLPLSALVFKTASLSLEEFLEGIGSPRAMASYRLTFGAALAGALANIVFGSIVAWVLVRYRFPGRRLVDALVDLPFALPTAVSGIALCAVYSHNGWIGRYLEPFGIQAAFSPLGVTIAMTFVGLPFVVRTLQPALMDLGTEIEEAAAMLGASRLSTLRRVILPAVLPALLTGFSLAFARALGEYGSVIFISSNKPLETEISSLLIITRLEAYDYAGATSLALVLLGTSFAALLVINLLHNKAALVQAARS
jgi:sulfate transport system permease protein